MKKKKSNLDKYIYFVLISTVIFTICMIVMYFILGSVPDTLIDNFYKYFMGGEAFFCCIIKSFKIIKEAKVATGYVDPEDETQLPNGHSDE